MNSLLKINNLFKTAACICNRKLQMHQQTGIAIPAQLLIARKERAAPKNTHVIYPFGKRVIHTSSKRYDLMEFFDDPKNWAQNEIKVGRAWNTDELRIKSNKELHQLWYVLLKERNMLLTMEHECNDKMELFPSPERLDKVKISMANLETVVRERNKAYHLLETGQTGERPQRVAANALGIKLLYRSSEHVLPPHMNVKWIKSRHLGYGGRAVSKFLLKYREKLYNVKRKAKNRERNEVMMLLRRNPNLDMAILRNRFPSVDIDKLVRTDKIRGHYAPKVEHES